MTAKEVVFADDYSVAGNLNGIKDYWDKLTSIGSKYGYFPKPTKYYLIVKEKNRSTKPICQFKSEITTEWKTHLGAVTEYLDEYVKDLVKDWDNQLTILLTIAETQLQAAYLAFATVFKSKLIYFLRTIPNIRHWLLPLERTSWNQFIPAVTGCHICSDKERVLTSLPTRYGGLAIPIIHETAEIEFMNSSKITSELTAYNIIEYNLKKLKNEMKKSVEVKYKNIIERLTDEMNDKGKRPMDISTLTGVSNWLIILPVTEFGFELSNSRIQ